MSLTDTAIKALKPAASRHVLTDGRGLCLEVLPSGVKSWRFRYRLRGRAETVTLGSYPALSLRDARERRHELETQVAKGVSPASQKRLERQAVGEHSTVREFGKRFVAEVLAKSRKDLTAPEAMLDHDIYAVIGDKPIRDVTVADCRAVIWRKKKAGYDAAAGQVRGLLKRLLDFAVTLGALPANPVLAIPMRHVHQQRSRDRVLSAEEIRVALRALYTDRFAKQAALAIHLILLTLVRKAELVTARWDNIDLERTEWLIPAERSKNGKPHIVYLSCQAVAIITELKGLAGDSPYVLPSTTKAPGTIVHNALNRCISKLVTLEEMVPFTVHDLRRTGSTLLHEQGWPADAIEKALNHTIGGVRGVYNKAEYAEQRREMLQHWGNWVQNLVTDGNVVFAKFPKSR